MSILNSRIHALFIAFICIFLVLNLQKQSYGVEEKDFAILSTRISDRADFGYNYSRLTSLLESVDAKVKQQARSFKNTSYRQAGLEVKAARNALTEADTAYSVGDTEKSKYMVNQAMDNLRTAQLYLMPSRVVEARGLYLDADSIPKTRSGIFELIKDLKSANFNIIYPEVYRRGYTMFSNRITEMDPVFKDVGFDVLASLIEEAHRNGIEVHPWVWTFRAKSPGYGDAMLNSHPNLVARRESYTKFDREPLFFSPAAPEARQLIAGLLKFMAANYDIDGILMDYIRYDETLGNDIISQRNFRLYYLDKYKKEPPLNISIGDPLFAEWQLWRESQVTQMVELVKREVNSVRPGTKLGVAVFRTEGEGRLVKMQDWRLWSSNQLVDYVCPMLYTDNTTDLNLWLDSETDRETRNDFIYPSLGAHKFGTADDFYPQAGLLNKRNIPGMNIFALTHYSRENFKDLAKGVFRKPAFIPGNGVIKSIKLILADTSGWLKDLLKNEKALPAAELKNLAFEFDTLNKSLPDNNKPYPDYLKLKVKLEDLSRHIDGLREVEAFPALFIRELKDPLSYAQKLLKVYTRMALTKGKPFPPSLPPLPILEETKELPVAEVERTYVQPELDGQLESSIWDKVNPLRNFYWHLGSARAEVETVVKLLYGTDNLYISFENFEPNMPKAKSISQDRDSTAILGDDSVEVFLQSPSSGEYYHFVVNMNNNNFDEKIHHIGWDGTWQSSVKKYDDKWIVEMQIPFADLNYTPASGSSLRANFIRNRWQEINPFSHWSPTYGGSHYPARFGTIVFR
jgi:uncharacterized lipoprotein YddW (UPF0748 family)